VSNIRQQLLCGTGYPGTHHSEGTIKMVRAGLIWIAVLSSFVCFARICAAQIDSREKALTAAEYAEKLATYQAARESFETLAGVYWQAVANKRRGRTAKRNARDEITLDDYVFTQPPIYSGPPRPVDPKKANEDNLPVKPTIPVVADFVRNAGEQYKFIPDRPAAENDFKKAYAATAKRSGLSRDQIVRIYGFEAGGDGKYDVQAGLEYPRPNARAISTALGYNQLLATNSVELLAEKGDYFVEKLFRKSLELSGQSRGRLDRKITVLRRMIDFSKTVSDDWSAHERLGSQPRGLAIHAMNLDIDVGPMLQTQKLLDSIIFAKVKAYKKPLTAAELEMMNLTGDGNGLDMISLPSKMRDLVPTSNFFQRGGYERNPVVIRNNTVSRLIAATDTKMDVEISHQGAKTLATLFDRTAE
jgi:hypothetical protein